MLKVKRVRKYSVAKYPPGNYQEPPEHLLPDLLKDSAMAAFMMLLVESCGGTTTGGVPNAPEIVTETEARSIVDHVLQNNGIAWQNDVPLTLGFGSGDTVHLVVDGYNDSLRVGYEYVTGNDNATFTPRVTAALDSVAKTQGPYIKIIEQTYKHDDSEYGQILEILMQQFLDTLKAHGVI
jgi:hypothetical protein